MKGEQTMQEYEVYTCIDDEEVKCSAAVRICKTCEYRELFECKMAVVKVSEEANE